MTTKDRIVVVMIRLSWLSFRALGDAFAKFSMPSRCEKMTGGDL